MIETNLPHWFLMLTIVALVAIPTGLAFRGKSANTIWPVSFACIAAVLLIRLPDVELFKAGPVEARMRQVTQRAEATIEQLQQLAAKLARPVMGSVIGAGRISGNSRRESLATRDDIVAELQALGLSDSQIKDASSSFNEFLGLDLIFDLARDAGVLKDGTFDPEPGRSCFLEENVGIIPGLTSSQIKECLSKVMPINGQIADDILDLEQFEKDHTLRRRDVFIQRRN